MRNFSIASYLPRISSSSERDRLFSKRISSFSSSSSPLTLADHPPSPWLADASSLPSVRRRARAADRDRDASKINRFADPIWKVEEQRVLYEPRTNRAARLQKYRDAPRRIDCCGSHKGRNPSAEFESSERFMDSRSVTDYRNIITIQRGKDEN